MNEFISFTYHIITTFLVIGLMLTVIFLVIDKVINNNNKQ